MENELETSICGRNCALRKLKLPCYRICTLCWKRNAEHWGTQGVTPGACWVRQGTNATGVGNVCECWRTSELGFLASDTWQAWWNIDDMLHTGWACEMQAVFAFTMLLVNTLEVCRLLSSDIDFKSHFRTLGRKKGRRTVNHDSPRSPPVSSTPAVASPHSLSPFPGD